MTGRKDCDSLQSSDLVELKRRLATCAPYYVNNTLTNDCKYTPCPFVPRECFESGYVFTLFEYLIDLDFTQEVARCPNCALPALRYTLLFPQIQSDYFLLDLYHDRLESPIRRGSVALVGIDFDIAFDVFQERLLTDVVYPALSVAIIFLVMWIYTSSLFITTLSIVAFVASLGVAYFFYMTVFRVSFFAFLNVIAIVIALGIGSDDVFVYIDVWRQTKRRHPNSSTAKRVAMTLRHAALSMFVTSFTTATAFISNIVSPITSVKCFGLYAGTAILVNYVFMITWLPAVVVFYEKYIESRFSLKRFVGTYYERLTGYLSIPFQKWIPMLVTKFKWPLLVVLTALAVGMSMAVFVKPRLQLPTSSSWQLFRTSDILSRYEFDMKSHFAFNGLRDPPNPADGMYLAFVFGVKAEDAGNHMVPLDDDSDSNFHLTFTQPSLSLISPAGQMWLGLFCDELKNQSFVYEYPLSSDADCFIRSVADFFAFLNTTESCDAYVAVQASYVNETSRRCCAVGTLPTDADTFAYCLQHWSIATQLGAVAGLTYPDDRLYFDDEGNLKAIEVTIRSTLDDSRVYVDMNREWHRVENWLDAISESAPSELRHGWFTGYGDFTFYDLQKSLNFGTLVSMGLSVGLSFVVLLITTFNIVISLYAVVTIAATLLSTVGTLVLLGWQLNILESVAMSIAVGLSVDFTVHYGVAYRVCPDERRRERTLFSVKHMGPAVTMAALTTFVAGAMMMPSSILAYTQLGTFLMLIMFFSWLYANFSFQPLCSLIGPQRTFGQLSVPSSLAFLDCYRAAAMDEEVNEDIYDGDALMTNMEEEQDDSDDERKVTPMTLASFDESNTTVRMSDLAFET